MATALLLAVASALTGCASRLPAPPSLGAETAPQSVRHWEGRMSLQVDAFEGQPAQAEQFHFELSGHARRGELLLSTPLGTQMAAVRWNPELAWVESIRGREEFTSVEGLTQALLGQALPLDTLMAWLEGRPDAALPWTVTEAEGTRFEQSGWHIDLRARERGLVEALRPPSPTQRGVRLKIRLDP